MDLKGVLPLVHREGVRPVFTSEGKQGEGQKGHSAAYTRHTHRLLLAHVYLFADRPLKAFFTLKELA
jgi:hypothetical protein